VKWWDKPENCWKLMVAYTHEAYGAKLQAWEIYTDRSTSAYEWTLDSHCTATVASAIGEEVRMVK
jgi:hypothetical protein